MTAYLQQLFQFGFYKRSQGKFARQTTFYALAIVVAAGVWSLKGSMEASDSANVANAAVPTALAIFALGCWATFRLIQLPQFADFLISVEAEMNKVSWPGRGELWKASLVVILTVFFLAAILFVYDLLWQNLLGLIIGRG